MQGSHHICASKFVLSIVCSFFSSKAQTMVMRKLSKQFDRAVLESTRREYANNKQKEAALLKKQELITDRQSAYFIMIERKRAAIRNDLFKMKECYSGYSSITNDILVACKTWSAVQSSDAIHSIAQGRQRVAMDQEHYRHRFLQSFREGCSMYHWMIIRDYSSIFAYDYKKKMGINGNIKCSEGTPVNLELVGYAFSEGMGPASRLIQKVHKLIINPKNGYETLYDFFDKAIPYMDWRVKRIPKRLFNDSEININLNEESDIGFLNAQYAHLGKFLLNLAEAFDEEKKLVENSPLYMVRKDLHQVDQRLQKIESRLDFTKMFRRVGVEEGIKEQKLQQYKIMQQRSKSVPRKQQTPAHIASNRRRLGRLANAGLQMFDKKF